MPPQVAQVHVCGPRYWQQDLSSAAALQALFTSRTLFVQRKSRALAYRDDPTGVRSLLSHAGAADTGDLAQLCATFAAEPFVMAFAQVSGGTPPRRPGIPVTAVPRVLVLAVWYP